MRLLFKHIRKSVFSAPVASLIVLITVFLSAVMFSFIGEFYFSGRDERDYEYISRYGTAHIELVPTDGRGTRYISPNALASIEGKYQSVLGMLDIPFYYGNHVVRGAACDLTSLQSVYELRLTAANTINTEKLNSAVYISQSFAKENSLSVGDNFEIELFGKTYDYTVYGINSFPYAGEYDVLFNIEGALRIICAVSPAFSIYNENNLPYNRLLITLCEGEIVKDAVDALWEDPKNIDLSINTLDGGSNLFLTVLLTAVLSAVLVLSLLIASVLLSFSLRIISEKRQRELEYFTLIGVSDRVIFSAFAIEIFIYIILGTAAGIFTAYLLAPMIFGEILIYVSFTLTIRGMLTAVVFMVLCGILALAMHRWRMKRKKRRLTSQISERIWPTAVFIGGGILFSALGVFSAPSIKCFFALPAAACIVLAVFFGVPRLLSAIAELFAKRAVLGKSRTPYMHLAARNNSGIAEMRQLHFFLIIAVSAMITLLLSSLYAEEFIDRNKNLISADYAISGISDISLTQDVLPDGTTAKGGAYFSFGILPSGQMVYMISCDDEFLCEGMGEAPRHNEIVLSRTVAEQLSLKIGDRIPIIFAGRERDFVIKDYSLTNTIFCRFSKDYFHLDDNIYLVKGSEGAEYYSALSSKVSEGGGFVESIESLTGGYLRTAYNFCSLLDTYVILMSILAAMGSINLIIVSYRSRREHFSALTLSGMTDGDIRKMLLCEALSALAVIIVIGGVTVLSLSGLLDICLQSFGNRFIIF